ncbi:MAG: HDOD domain-containing protein [Gammaproteobacteria bacterium]|nr:HDOD domain-containing protein [Gammaproteobacteria bacterium]
MAVRDDLQLAGEFVRHEERPAVPHVDPNISVGDGRQVNAAQIVMGLARELNTDRVELPGFPDIVARIQRALADETTSARDVVKLVASEPVLAARLLHLANSAAFNKSGREVSDLRSAISNLGFNIVRSQATAFAMRQMEQQEWLRPIRPVLADIWKTSNGVAALCFAVARRVQGVAPDEAMSAGLFHLIGKLYLFARARQESIDPAAIADWERALNEWHCTIARTIMDHWKIPARVAEAVENQNAIFDAENRDLTPLTRILCAAKLHQRLRRPGAAAEPEAEAALASVRLDGKPFEELFRAAQAEAEAARSALA